MDLLGAPWVDRQKSIVEEYAQQYHQITWEPLIRGLNTEADDLRHSNLQRRKSAVKDRFKAFNNALDDIHNTQMEWIIPDPDLKRKVRRKILNTVVPEYQHFYNTFSRSGFTKNPEKYVKYEAHDVQRVIEDDLFENKIQTREQRRLPF